VNVSRHADTVDEAQELGAAAEEDVLAVIDLDTVDDKRRRASPEQPAPLEDLDVESGISQIEPGSKAS